MSNNYYFQIWFKGLWRDTSEGLLRREAIELWILNNKEGRVIHRDEEAVVKELVVRQIGVWEG